jgi:uncharacterized protein YebE (UPF0316 family)
MREDLRRIQVGLSYGLGFGIGGYMGIKLIQALIVGLQMSMLVD